MAHYLFTGPIKEKRDFLCETIRRTAVLRSKSLCYSNCRTARKKSSSCWNPGRTCAVGTSQLFPKPTNVIHLPQALPWLLNFDIGSALMQWWSYIIERSKRLGDNLCVDGICFPRVQGSICMASSEAPGAGSPNCQSMWWCWQCNSEGWARLVISKDSFTHYFGLHTIFQSRQTSSNHHPLSCLASLLIYPLGSGPPFWLPYPTQLQV